MNRFLTHDGLLPFFLGDIDFMSEVFRDTIAKIASGLGLGKRSFILSGFNVDSSYDSGKVKYAWDDGAVVIDGEIYSVSAGSLTYDPNSGPMQSPVGLKIEISNDPAGRRPLKSGEMVECWQTRKAVVTAFNYDISLRSLRRFEDLLAESITASLPPFREVDIVNDEAPVFFNSGASAGISHVRITSISGALYLLFSIKVLANRVGDKLSRFVDADFELSAVENSASIANVLGKGTTVFILPTIKTTQEATTYDSMLCAADISHSTSNPNMVHIRIAPSTPIEGQKIQGECFIRLEF